MNNVEKWGGEKDTWQCGPNTPREKSSGKFTQVLGAWQCVGPSLHNCMQLALESLPLRWSKLGV